MHTNHCTRLVRFGAAALLAVFALNFQTSSVFAADQDAHAVETNKAVTVDVTVYGNSFAQIEETRQVELKAGRNRIQLNGIAAQYRQDTLRVISAQGPGKFTYKSATYQGANLNWEQILSRSVGQQVAATVGYGENASTINAKLIAVNGSQLVLQDAAGKTYLTGSSSVTLSSLPDGLSNTASLVVEAVVETDGFYALNFLYETSGMTWSTQHSVIYDDEKQSLESFSSNVNIVNNSGTTFEDATLWLLSGDINDGNRSRGGPMRLSVAASYESQSADTASGAESVGERKVYRIAEKISLGQGQSRQIPLFTGTSVPVKREYFVNTQNLVNYGQPSNGFEPVSVRLKLKNCQESHLGTPLPAGVVKVYQRNSESKLQLTGATQVKELAVDEPFALVIGTSSEVKADMKMTKAVDAGLTSGRSNEPQYQDRTFEVTAHNFKKSTDVEVIVETTVPAEQQNVAPLTRETATSATGTISVAAGKDASLTFTLHVRTR